MRQAAGLFDVSHMGLFEFSGENVHLFLTTCTNDVSFIEDRRLAVFLPAGARRQRDRRHLGLPAGRERYWMVVNAANNDKDWAWLNAVREARVLIDPARPWSRALGYESVAIRDLRDPQWGDGQRHQLALQGPKSADILLALAGSDDGDCAPGCWRCSAPRSSTARWPAMTSSSRAPATPASRWPSRSSCIPTICRASGATCFAVGRPFGLKPIGLAARDSLRIEAGLPLYGHELAGPLDLNPADAGFAPYVKLVQAVLHRQGSLRSARSHTAGAAGPLPAGRGTRADARARAM